MLPQEIIRAKREGRALTDDEIARIRWYSDSYVNYRLDYSTETRTSKPMGFK